MQQYYDKIYGQDPQLVKEFISNLDKISNLAERSPKDDFDLLELNAAIDTIKTGKAAGEDDVQGDFLKALSEIDKLCLLKLLNQRYHGTITKPECWYNLIARLLRRQ